MRRFRAWLERWKRTPRRTVRRWDLGRDEITTAFMIVLMPWAGAIGLLTNAARATGTAGRVWFAGLGLLAVAIGTGTTWLSVLYLRRPTLDSPEPQPVSADETARAESERRAWRSR